MLHLYIHETQNHITLQHMLNSIVAMTHDKLCDGVSQIRNL